LDHYKNILLKTDPKNPHVPIVKVSGFNFSKILEKRNDMLETYVGTRVCMAPEIYNRKKYDYKCDFWSLGCIFYYLRTHDFPLSKSKIEFEKRMENCQIKEFDEKNWGTIPDLKNLVQKLLVFKNEKRYGWKQVLAHKFLDNIDIKSAK